MEFDRSLIKGKLVKRYKRFFADVTLEDGSLVTAHCPNTGSMRTCGAAGDVVYLQPNDDPKRKLKFTWELTKTTGGFIGINTGRPNQVVYEAIDTGKVKELRGYDRLLREKKYGTNSRIDILLESDTKPKCYVEVKNTTLFEDDRLIFPDAVTTRGLKHIDELCAMVDEGHRAVMFYLCNRPEGKSFAPAAHIDPKYAEALERAKDHGVEILAYRATHTLKGISLGEKLPIKLK